MNQSMHSQPVFMMDPYVVQTLQSVIGRRLVIETTRDSVFGKLVDVKPDHIVINVDGHGRTFFIRIAQIVSIMPTD